VYTATYKLNYEEKISQYTEKPMKKRTRVYYHIEPDGKTIWKNWTLHIKDIQKESIFFWKSLKKATKNNRFNCSKTTDFFII
jgi:hypothetical protein